MEGHKKKKSHIGPGTLVTAAFIGPGTVTTCIRAGVEDRYALLWAVVFATTTTIILQSTAARIGIVTQTGLGENIRRAFHSQFMKVFAIFLVFSAILIGNSAFETGNITGVVIGIQMLFPEVPRVFCVISICLLILLLIILFKFERVQHLLMSCVFLMSIVFVGFAIASRPSVPEILHGFGSISLGSGGLMNVLGLIGTTIGPYGLFLHSYAAAHKWSKVEDIAISRYDSIVSIAIGGIITACIIIAAAASLDPGASITVSYVSDLSDSLVTKWGTWTKYILSIGLMLAGFSSCLTAPIGAAIATLGVCGKSADFSKFTAKIMAVIVVLVGMFFSVVFGSSPTQLILFAQIINALILPLIACFMLVCANSEVMGNHKNSAIQNIESSFVILLCLLICIRSIINAIH